MISFRLFQLQMHDVMTTFVVSLRSYSKFASAFVKHVHPSHRMTPGSIIFSSDDNCTVDQESTHQRNLTHAVSMSLLHQTMASFVNEVREPFTNYLADCFVKGVPPPPPYLLSGNWGYLPPLNEKFAKLFQ